MNFHYIMMDICLSVMAAQVNNTCLSLPLCVDCLDSVTLATDEANKVSFEAACIVTFYNFA